MFNRYVCVYFGLSVRFEFKLFYLKLGFLVVLGHVVSKSVQTYQVHQLFYYALGVFYITDQLVKDSNEAKKWRPELYLSLRPHPNPTPAELKLDIKLLLQCSIMKIISIGNSFQVVSNIRVCCLLW